MKILIANYFFLLITMIFDNYSIIVAIITAAAVAIGEVWLSKWELFFPSYIVCSLLSS